MKLTVMLFFMALSLSCNKPVKNENDISPNPLILSVETQYDDLAVYGEPVIVKGANFSSDVAENEILLGIGLDMKSIKPLEASEERLVFEAPVLGESSVKMRVRSKGKVSELFTLKYDLVRCDSVVLFENAKVTKLREGVVWTSIYKEWEGAIRSINLLTIEPSGQSRLFMAFPTVNARTSEQCLEHGAFLGINGSYFKSTFVRVDGKVMSKGSDSGNAYRHDGVFTIDNNVPGIAYVGSNKKASELPNANVMTCGPLLIDEGVHRYMMNDSHNTTTHPRTGVGLTEDGKVLFVTVDGRFPDLAVGLPTTLFIRLMEAFGAEEALNLDGGGSTTMWIEGYGVVNHPCDGLKWDNPVERAVESIIYMK